MKKSIRILALALVAVMLCLSLTACGKKLSGSYEAEIDLALVKYTATYEFSGSKVTATKEGTVLGKVNTVEFTGTYEIEDDKITFTWDGDEEDDVIKGGTFTFKETDDGIKIGEAEYKKK